MKRPHNTCNNKLMKIMYTFKNLTDKLHINFIIFKYQIEIIIFKTISKLLFSRYFTKLYRLC